MVYIESVCNKFNFFSIQQGGYMYKFLSFFIILAFSFLISCSEDSGGISSTEVEENGLTPDINDLVPDSLLLIMDSLGMPIHGGGNPPNIENSYLCTPFILLASNRVNDNPGAQFSDYYINFRQQNNSDLTVNLDYINGPETGNGIGSFIVGTVDSFSVFARLTVTVFTDSAYVLVLFSGRMDGENIADFHIALFMLDDLGDPSNYFIENGEGRIFYDSDGISERTEGVFSKNTKSFNLNTSLKSSFQQ
jgi:hypothetical protein